MFNPGGGGVRHGGEQVERGVVEGAVAAAGQQAAAAREGRVQRVQRQRVRRALRVRRVQ